VGGVPHVLARAGAVPFEGAFGRIRSGVAVAGAVLAIFFYDQHSKVPELAGRFLARSEIVERTLAWLGKFRRLNKDYERTTARSEAWIDVAMINLIVRRLAPS